jgi:hypothetical protein
MSNQKKEPIKNRKIWIILGVITLLIVPWYLPTGSYKPLIFGIPYWALIVIVMSLILSAFLSYVIKHEWQIEEDDEEQVKGEK